MVELGESFIPLEKDILKKKVEFVKTWIEWSSENREQVQGWNFAQNINTSTIYTVPDNFTLFITHLALNLHTVTSTAMGDVWITIKQNSNTNRVLMLSRGNVGSNTHDSTAVSFTMPLKVESGELVQISSNVAGMVGNGIMSGWIEPKKI